MRQAHAGGEKLFVNYAGDRVQVFDRLTGEARPAWIFVTPNLRNQESGSSYQSRSIWFYAKTLKSGVKRRLEQV
jgi:hypothetical protein